MQLRFDADNLYLWGLFLFPNTLLNGYLSGIFFVVFSASYLLVLFIQKERDVIFFHPTFSILVLILMFSFNASQVRVEYILMQSFHLISAMAIAQAVGNLLLKKCLWRFLVHEEAVFIILVAQTCFTILSLMIHEEIRDISLVLLLALSAFSIQRSLSFFNIMVIGHFALILRISSKMSFILTGLCVLFAFALRLNRARVRRVFVSIVPFVSAFLIGASVVLPLILSDANRELLFHLDGNVWIRLEAQYAAFLSWYSNVWSWFIGQGFGVPYRYDLGTYFASHSMLVEDRLLYTAPNHNSYFDAAYRLGLPILLVLVWYQTMSLRRVNASEFSAIFSISFLLVILGMCVNPWLQDNRYVLYPAFFFGALFALNSAGSPLHKMLISNKNE